MYGCKTLPGLSFRSAPIYERRRTDIRPIATESVDLSYVALQPKIRRG